MRNWLVGLACLAARTYLRWPFPGKRVIWYHVVRPYILWRSLPTVAVTKFGAKLEGDTIDVIHSYLYFLGVWEPGITKLFSHHLRAGDVCIDIGANVGAHTLLAAKLVGSQGHVHAIEASPTIFRSLTRNLALNSCRQVRTYNVAVTDKIEPVKIYLHDPSNLGATTIMLEESKNLPTTNEVTIEGRPLAAILPMEEIKSARLIKIDVEGAEWLVLQGMRDLFPLLRHDCLIVVEVNSAALAVHGIRLDDVIALFGESGFQPFEISNSYKPDFYLKPLGRTLTTNIRTDAPLIDLGFAKSDMRDALLQADRA